MNVELDDSVQDILGILLNEEKPMNLDLNLTIDENVFMKNIDMRSESEFESDSDDDSIRSYSSIEEEKKPFILEEKESSIMKLPPKEKKTYQTKIPFMQRLYEYCINIKNREWIDFYREGGVWIKNIKKMKEDCPISPLLKIKFTSFRKMLTNYGFTGSRHFGLSSNETVYQHPQFKKDSYEQCLRIIPRPEKLRSHLKETDNENDNPYRRKKRNPKRKKVEISDSSSEQSSNPPKKSRFLSGSKNTFSELNESLSHLIEKMNKIKSDLESSRLSRTEFRQYQHKIQVIKDILN